MAKSLSASAPEFHPTPAGTPLSTPAATPLSIPYIVWYTNHVSPSAHLSQYISTSHVTQPYPPNCYTSSPQCFNRVPFGRHSPAASRPKSEFRKCFSSRRGSSGNGKGRRGVEKLEWNNPKTVERRIVRHQIMHLDTAEKKTTVMIRNINYSFRQEDLIALVDGFCSKNNAIKGRNDEICAYDFLYLPIDFRTEKSRGFAFVNFTNAATAMKFHQEYNSFDWKFSETTKWYKSLEVVSAKYQGKEALVSHFSGSIFCCTKKEFLPVCFRPERNGSGFPVEMNYIGKRAYSSCRG